MTIYGVSVVYYWYCSYACPCIVWWPVLLSNVASNWNYREDDKELFEGLNHLPHWSILCSLTIYLQNSINMQKTTLRGDSIDRQLISLISSPSTSPPSLSFPLLLHVAPLHMISSKLNGLVCAYIWCDNRVTKQHIIKLVTHIVAICCAALQQCT